MIEQSIVEQLRALVASDDGRLRDKYVLTQAIARIDSLELDADNTRCCEECERQWFYIDNENECPWCKVEAQAAEIERLQAYNKHCGDLDDEIVEQAKRIEELEEVEEAARLDFFRGRAETDKALAAFGYDDLRFADVRHGWVYSTRNIAKLRPSWGEEAAPAAAKEESDG